MEQQQPPTPLGAPAACNFCGKPLTPDQIYYTADARIACISCNAKVDVVAADQRVGGNILNGAIYAIASAGVSLIFNPFAIVSISSMIAAIYALTSVSRKGDERFTQHIQKSKGAILAMSIIALVIDALVLILFLLAVIAIGSVRRHSSSDF